MNPVPPLRQESVASTTATRRCTPPDRRTAPYGTVRRRTVTCNPIGFTFVQHRAVRRRTAKWPAPYGHFKKLRRSWLPLGGLLAAMEAALAGWVGSYLAAGCRQVETS